MVAGVHPTAQVDKGARIGPGCRIGPYCVVGADVTLGEGCRLGPHVVLEGPAAFGARNHFHSGAVLGGAPQDLKYRGERTELVAGDDTVFREHVTVNRGTAGGGGVTRIGSRNLVMACAHVAHDCELGDDIVLANGVLLAGHVRIESRAILSGACAVHHFVTIGTLSFVGGLTRVTRDVPPYVLFEGYEGEVRGLNRVGLARAGLSPERLEALKRVFRMLFRAEGNVREAIGTLRAEGPTAEVAAMIASLEASEAGRFGRALEAAREKAHA